LQDTHQSMIDIYRYTTEHGIVGLSSVSKFFQTLTWNSKIHSHICLQTTALWRRDCRTEIQQFSVPTCSFLFQLSISRSKPPAGGVEAMFHAAGGEKSFHYQGTNHSSASESNHENNMNLNNTTSAPIPKPRSKQPTTGTKEMSIKHSLSDWDLQDFDD